MTGRCAMMIKPLAPGFAGGVPRAEPGANGRCRRGTVYIAVLGAAMLVTILGVSALLAVQAQRQAEQLDQDAVQASFLARSAVDCALRAIQNNSNWRTSYTHDTWSSSASLGRGNFRFKFVASSGSSLSAAIDQSVDVVGLGEVSGVQRLERLTLNPVDLRGLSAATNLLTNPSFSTNADNWQFPTWTLNLAVDGSNARSGPYSLSVSGRSSVTDGPQQDLTSKLVNGLTCDTSVWIRSSLLTDSAKIQLYVRSTDSGTQTFSHSSSGSTIDTNWRLISGSITPRWQGQLLEARWQIVTNNGTGSYYIDDAYLAISSTSPRALTLSPDTWRQQLP
ncbi:MAG: carbohydrate binding domain-containing protein [Phycisphaeraceae bacterium]|nr:carbohydrate binding domain-containing protein [Phycisphaeraceae bacterium]